METNNIPLIHTTLPSLLPQLQTKTIINDSIIGGGINSGGNNNCIIQTALDKNIINQSMDLLTNIDVELTNHIVGKNTIKLEKLNEIIYTTNKMITTNDNDCGDDDDDDDNNITTGGGGGMMDTCDDDLNNDNNNDDDYNSPLINEQNIIFNLQLPTIVPSYLSLHYLCESGSRLLFQSVYWFKKINAFKMLK